MELSIIILISILTIVLVIFFILFIPLIFNLYKKILSDKKQNNIGTSSKIRLINQLREAVEFLSDNKIGAIITIENNDKIDHLRTDGVRLDANISASLIISIFNKYSPLHDGAIVIRNGKIVYAATYYKITKKSVDNKYGARHRAAMGISEISDATTIVVSEETGKVIITRKSTFITIELTQFQEKLIFFLKD